MPGTIGPNLGADLVRIHSVITRGLRVSMDHCRAFARDGFPDEATRQGFFTYVRTLAGVTHGHHVTEDDVAFPFFRDLLPDIPYTQLAVEHQQMENLLQQAAQVLEQLQAGPNKSGKMSELHQILGEIDHLWHPHIDIEETYLTAATVDRLLDEQQRADLSRQASEISQEHSGPGPLALPFVLFNMSPEDRTVFSRALPPELVNELIPGPWKAQWDVMGPFLLK